MRTLVTIALDEDSGELVALTGETGIDVASQRPVSEDVEAHRITALDLVSEAFRSLEVEGFPRGGPR